MIYKNHIIRSFVLFCICFILYSGTYIGASESSKKEVRIGWLEVTGTITKENYENISGYARRYLDKIAQYADWDLVFVKDSFANLYPMLLSGEIDIIPSFGYSEERATLVNYPEREMGFAYTTLYVRENSLLSMQNLSGLNHLRVGALSPDEINKVNLDKFAEEHDLYFYYKYYESYDEIRLAVLGGRVDAGVEPNHKDDDLTKTILQFAPRNGYLACTPADPSIVEGVNFAQNKLLEVNLNYLNDLMTRYHPRAIPTEFVLSHKEQSLIQRTPPLKVLVGDRWQPYEFYNQRTKIFSGYIVDLYHRVSDLTGLKFEFVYNDGTNQSVDIISMSDNYTPTANESGYKITEPFLTLPLTLIYKGKPKLENGKTALVEGMTMSYKYFKDFTDWTSEYYENANACLEAVRKGKVNQTILDSFTTNYEIERKRKFSNLTVKIMDESFELSSLINEDLDTDLFHILNKSLFYVSTSSSNFFLLQNAYKSNEIGIESIINKMPMDIILLLMTLLFIIAIVFILYRTKTVKEKLEIRKNVQLQDALLSAEKANEAKTDFTSRISHEIRSPLNAVIGYMALIKVEEKDPLALSYLQKAESAAQQLLSLLNDVLDMSRIESGKIKISKTELKIHTIIDTLATLFANEAKNANLEFAVSMNELKDETLVGDQLRLLQVLTNLLSNAIKFTPAGGRVHFSVKEEQRRGAVVYMQFIVEDTGIGIAPDFLDKLFSPYERQNVQNDSKISGSGLGLAITKNLIYLMEGTINVKSEVGKGTTFTALIPFELKDISKKTKPKDRICFDYDTTSFDYTGKKILVAEDNEMNTEIICELLKKYKITVETAANGEEALNIFLSKEPHYYDLIFMDIQMPLLDGYETTKSIRSSKHPQAKTIPIIAMTAHAFAEDISKSFSVGMNKHLAKPIDLHELCKILKEFLGN